MFTPSVHPGALFSAREWGIDASRFGFPLWMLPQDIIKISFMALKCFVCVRIVGSVYLQLRPRATKLGLAAPALGSGVQSLWSRDLCDFWPK